MCDNWLFNYNLLRCKGLPVLLQKIGTEQKGRSTKKFKVGCESHSTFFLLHSILKIIILLLVYKLISKL